MHQSYITSFDAALRKINNLTDFSTDPLKVEFTHVKLAQISTQKTALVGTF
jgi:hypothetical protein